MTGGVRLGELTHENFEPLVGSEVAFQALEESGAPAGEYRFVVDEVSVNRRLAEAAKACEPGSIYQRIPFSVILRANGEPPFVQAVLRLEHPGFEDCDLMITRIVMPGHDPRAAWFEAVFG